MGVLRLLLAFSVLLAHSQYIIKANLLGGPLAVKAFFIISGFYMSLILNEKYITNDSYKLFITNRFMRIYPVYAAVFVISVLFFVFAYYVPPQNENFRMFFNNPIQKYATHLSNMDWSTFLFVTIANITIFFQDIIMFISLDPSGNPFFTSNFRLTQLPLFTFLFIPQAWSITLECMYYLIAPFLVRRKLFFIVSLIAITFVFRFTAYYYGYSNDPWNYRFFPFELGYFLMGTLSYFIYKRIPGMKLKPLLQQGLAAVPLGMTAIYPLLRFPGSEYAYCLVFLLCLPFLFHVTKDWKYDTYVGDLSYPMYLVHVLVLFAMRYFAEGTDKRIMAVVYIPAVLLFSVLLNELISKKIEELRKRRYIAFRNQKLEIPK